MEKYETSNNRIWVELEPPDNDQEGYDRAEALSKILNILGVGYKQPVFYSPKKGCYCFQVDGGGSYVEAGDHGHWYNLDYLAKQGRK